MLPASDEKKDEPGCAAYRHVDESAPGLFLFGSSGGGEAFAFDTRTVPPSIVAVPFIVLDLEDAIAIAPNFNAFLQHLYTSEDLF